jgi:ProP effector
MPAARREAPAERRTDARPDAQPGARPDAQRAAPPAPRRRTDGQRADRRSDAARPSSPERPEQRPLRSELAPRAAHAQRPEATTPALAAAALPVDPAQRERMLLLRSYESSPLSKANFCALKGITEAALDAALAESRAEHGAPPVVPASPGSRVR